MGARIVQTSENVTLAGAGPINKAILDVALTYAPFLVAADGGAEMVQKYGRRPRKVVGDMDSLRPAARAALDAGDVVEIAEQDSTDFDKALRVIEAPLIVGVGFLGGRADHQMAALNRLGRHEAGRVVLLGPDDVVFRVPEQVALTLEPGTRVSLYPVTQARVDSRGLRWPLSDVVLDVGGLVSQSNEAAAQTVELWTMGSVLAFLPAQALAPVVASLMRSRQTT